MKSRLPILLLIVWASAWTAPLTAGEESDRPEILRLESGAEVATPALPIDNLVLPTARERRGTTVSEGAPTVPAPATASSALAATADVASGAAFLTALAGGAPIPAAGLLPMNSPRELRLGIAQAVEAALRQNHDLRVRRYETDVSDIEARRARTVFDPTVSAEVSAADRQERQRNAGGLVDRAANGAEGRVAVRRTSPSGTRSTFGLIMSRDRSATFGNLFDTRVGLDIVRPLRQGAGRTVNLIDLRQAELDLKASRHELEGFVLSLVAEVERKYWTFFLAVRELSIVEESKRLAQLQLEEVQKKIVLGGVPESEQAAAEAELALREEAVIDARSAVETARLGLLRLINVDSDAFWIYAVSLEDEPEEASAGVGQPPEHLAEALSLRPELLAAKVLLARDGLEVVRTRNGLLPKLDFFLTLGKSGYSRSFDGSVSAMDERGYDLQAGLRYELFGGKRDARLADRKARLTRDRREEALRNLTQLIQEDVLTAWLELQRARQQLVATGKTVAKQQEKLRVEETRFKVGKNTAFQVAQAQRDFAASRIAELQARVACILAETELFRMDGSLCRRRGIRFDAGGETAPAPVSAD